LLLDAGGVLLPAVVRKGSHIVEDEAVILGVELGGVGDVAGAPSGAIVVNEFAEGGGVGGFLLGACTGEGEQASEESNENVEDPVMARSDNARLNGRVHRH